jgi:hypothetical protein
MAVDQTLKPLPFGGGNPALWRLKHDVEDERFQTIFGDFAHLIRRSELACERAAKQDDPDYRDHVVDGECEYLEELIGASFLVLQAKIRRVFASAEVLRTHMLERRNMDLPSLSRGNLMKLGGPYNGTRLSLVQLIWNVGNYYKHRDEWLGEVWEDDPEREKGRMVQFRDTRRGAEPAGITFGSTGNLRTAYEFFGVHPYSKCAGLAENVQAWAKDVLSLARTQIATELKR